MIGAVIRTRTVLGAMSCLSVLALAACAGEEPQPKLAPSPSPSAAPSPSSSPPEPVEPTMPAAARGTDAAAAEAFVKFYWEMADYAQATGDLEGLRGMGHDHCSACQQALDFLESVAARNGRIRGGETTVAVVTSAPVGDTGERRVVRFDLTSTRQVVDLPGQAHDEVYPAGTVKAEAIVRSTPDGWLIEYWGEQP